MKWVEPDPAQVALDGELDGVLLIASCVQWEVLLPLTVRLWQLLGPPEHLSDFRGIGLTPESQDHLAPASAYRSRKVGVVSLRRQMHSLVSDFQFQVIQLAPAIGVFVELPLTNQLRALRPSHSGIELDAGQSLAGLNRGQLHEPILQLEPAETGVQRSTIEGIEQ